MTIVKRGMLECGSGCIAAIVSLVYNIALDSGIQLVSYYFNVIPLKVGKTLTDTSLLVQNIRKLFCLVVLSISFFYSLYLVFYQVSVTCSKRMCF